MTDVIPIPTRYKGYHFRSRLEARWAVCFDYLGWPWEYEPEGYLLPSGPYLPDFRVGNQLWIEIKPSVTEAPSHPFSCWLELVEATKIDLRIFFGTPGLHHEANITYRPGHPPFPDVFYLEEVLSARDKTECGVHPRLLAAWEAGRSARFEHGQSGAS